MRRPAAVVILAAGEGTRMRSTTPKVLHEVAGRSLLGHVLAVVDEVDPEHVIVVVGHGRDAVRTHAEQCTGRSLTFVVQESQDGTGHAVRVALEQAASQGVLLGDDAEVVVLSGDTPLITAATLGALVDAHRQHAAAATVLTAEVADPSGYGRILRDGERILGIVEHRDASPDQRSVREVNSGVYAFRMADLVAALARLSRANSQGEEYLTDVVALLSSEGGVVAGVQAADPREVLGVNDRAQAAEAGAVLRDRACRMHMLAGVTIVDPATTWVGPHVRIEPDAVLLPGTHLVGATSIAAGAVIGPDTTLVDCVVGPGAHIRRSEATGAEIGPDATVGPFSYLRPGSRLLRGAKVGAYVEVKNAVIGEGAKVPHLSYVGDAEIGEGSNIGAATVFVNYDGIDKHRTIVGRHVRIGSDTMLVAPVTVGDGAYTAAGSVITDDVPPGAMAVARARQRIIAGWVRRRRAGTASAAAAESAAPGFAAPGRADVDARGAAADSAARHEQNHPHSDAYHAGDPGATS